MFDEQWISVTVLWSDGTWWSTNDLTCHGTSLWTSYAQLFDLQIPQYRLMICNELFSNDLRPFPMKSRSFRSWFSGKVPEISFEYAEFRWISLSVDCVDGGSAGRESFRWSSVCDEVVRTSTIVLYVSRRWMMKAQVALAPWEPICFCIDTLDIIWDLCIVLRVYFAQIKRWGSMFLYWCVGWTTLLSD